jgi:hypothetical protein
MNVAWKFFHLIYRGGPAIVRQSKDIYSPRVMNSEIAVLKIQAIVRGYLARINALERRHRYIHIHIYYFSYFLNLIDVAYRMPVPNDV